MTKIKTSELTGSALDWAVAKCENFKCKVEIEGIVWLVDSRGDISRNFNPSSNWSWGGPIIERECICICPGGGKSSHWEASIEGEPPYSEGVTPLIAAMRCFVASRLGDKIEIPEELT